MWKSFKNVGWQTSENVTWEKGQRPQNLQKWVLAAVRGHTRSLAMSPLLDHTWFQVVIRSNDKTILYSCRKIARYYVKNRKIYPSPRINYRVDLRQHLTDPYQIWWTYTLIITSSSVHGLLPGPFLLGFCFPFPFHGTVTNKSWLLCRALD